jgi:epoxide hydrolase-like predicted phosphatase
MIKAIIFDFGGPIVEWASGMFEVYKKYEESHKLEDGALHDILQKYVHEAMTGKYSSLTHFLEEVRPPIALSVNELNKIFDESNEAIYIRPEMVEYIVELKKTYKIALLSNFTVGLQSFLQDVFRIYHLFDVIVSSYDVKMRKPDPEIYKYTLDQLGVKAEEAVFIDDLIENVEAAEKLGIKSIIFKDSKQCMEELDLILKS